ncbi:hypothetical protein niasHT_014705 [Heterodera trifolii]|uniref:AAA+ ATPase domain-containing protein n=1 Tax=Heterodera trifolii TaxID=157864 RepID=A0ABD2KWL6_9BILA
MKSVMLNPKQNAEVVKKIEECRGSIEGLASDKSIAEKIVNLLQRRDEISHLILDKTDSFFDDFTNSEAKKALQTLVLPLQYPDLFKGFLSPQTPILLVGAQAGGKAMLAKAVAKASSAKLFSIPSSVILSKKDESSVDFIKMLFQMAKNVQPSIIFIDEIDALLRRGTERRGKAQFLIEMDRISSKSEISVFVIGTTGQPQEIDEDASGRFAKRIFVEIPKQEKRENMLEKIVEENKNYFELSDEEIDQLVPMTEKYSFDDLLLFCQMARLDVLHNANEENDFFQGAMVAQSQRIKMHNLVNAIEKVQPKPKKAENELKKQKSKVNKRIGKEKESQNE